LNERIIFQNEMENLKHKIYTTNENKELVRIKNKYLELYPKYCKQKEKVDNSQNNYKNNPSIVMYDDCLLLLETKINQNKANTKSNIALFIAIISIIASIITSIMSIVL